MPNNSPSQSNAPFSTPVHLNERSVEVQDFISFQPPFWVRYGLGLISLVLLLLLLVSRWIPYPERVRVAAVIQVEDLREIVPPADGKIMYWAVHQNQKVQKGSLVAWLENRVTPALLQAAFRQVDSASAYCKRNDRAALALLKRIDSLNGSLGDLQADYERFWRVLQKWQLSQSNGKRGHALTANDKDNNDYLLLKTALHHWSQTLRGWKEHFGVVAPADGWLSLTDQWEEGKTVSAQTVLGYVLPLRPVYKAKVWFDLQTAYKIKEGQEVLLKLKSYSFQQYGGIQGHIGFIARVPSEKGFAGYIHLDPVSVAAFEKKAKLWSGGAADGEVLIKKRRMSDNFFSIFKEH